MTNPPTVTIATDIKKPKGKIQPWLHKEHSSSLLVGSESFIHGLKLRPDNKVMTPLRKVRLEEERGEMNRKKSWQQVEWVLIIMVREGGKPIQKCILLTEMKSKEVSNANGLLWVVIMNYQKP